MYMCPFSGCVELLNGKIPGVHIQLDEKDYLDMRTLTIEKVKPTDKKYPRGKNLPRLKPLVASQQ